jgi:hypothetical protein
LKRVNSSALLADVITSSGAKIGHISNQLSFEDVEKYSNVVLFTGINNVPGPNERVDENNLGKQIDTEMKALEGELSKLAKKGKNVFLTQVANPKHARLNTRNTNIRNKINKDMIDMKNRLKAQYKKVKIDTINWSVFVDEDDYETVKAVSEKALVSWLHKVDEKIEGPLRAKYLDTKLTTEPNTRVTSTYPLGCRKCTKMEHSEYTCTVDYSKKRNRSEESEMAGPAPKVSSIEPFA